jgi:hypothetical protein
MVFSFPSAGEFRNPHHNFLTNVQAITWSHATEGAEISLPCRINLMSYGISYSMPRAE